MKGFVCVILLLLAACGEGGLVPPIVDSRGYEADPEIKKQLVVGVSTREDVRALLGSPSTQSAFGEEMWYYIHAKKERTAFFEPEITEQGVTRVRFDAQGMLAGIDEFSKEDAQQIDVVDKVTPTEGHKLGFFEQVIGNIGRFTKPTEE